MKRTPQRIIAVLGMILTCSCAIAQPLHQPIPNYTSDAPHNRPGHGSKASAFVGGGLMEETMGGIAVNGFYHFLVQNWSISSGVQGIAIDRKDASNGTSTGVSYINLGLHQGQGASTDRARGVMLYPSLNRIYIYGKTNGNAFILCCDMSTLAPDPAFGTNGLAIIQTGAEATGMVDTGNSNMTVSINKGQVIELREYTSAGVLVQSGTISAAAGSTCTSANNALKKAPNGHFFVVGSVNATANPSTKIPMVWDCVRNSGSYGVALTTNPSTSGVGNAAYVDFDFYVNPNPANPGTYLFDLIAIGNTAVSVTGIYARYIVSNAAGFLTPDPTFTNQSGIPGTVGQNVKFTRCSMGANGYTTVLGFYNPVSSGSTMDRGLTGYIDPNGYQYVQTYTEPTPSPMSDRIHKTGAMTRDISGNILIAGCTMGQTHTITKLSDTYDCMPVFGINGTSSVICHGDPASLSVNVYTPNCTVTWKRVSPEPATLYSGLPSSLQIYPTKTGSYTCTVTSIATGCQVTVPFAIQVNNDPSFTLGTNTMSPSYHTLSAMANDQTAASQPGFGFVWIVEELDLTTNNPIFTFTNPSCWWNPISSPNVFNGINCLINNYSGASTIANCSTPTVGKFRYDHRYRITRGTWNNVCGWQQSSITIQPTMAPPGLAPHDDIIQDAPAAPDFSHLAGTPVFNAIPQLVLFPNPGNGQFTVSTEATFTGDFHIYDVTGKLMQLVLRTGTGEQLIDARKLTPGVYYLQASVNGVLQMEKFIVE